MNIFILPIVVLCVLVGFVYCYQCPPDNNIFPCTCYQPLTQIRIRCNQIYNFSIVEEALKDKIDPDTFANLWISQSNIDLEQWKFSELGIHLESIRFQHTNFSSLSDSAFEDLDSVHGYEVTEGHLEVIPANILMKFPFLRTLTLASNKIEIVGRNSFQNNGYLQHLVLASNKIFHLEEGSIPSHLRHLHLGHNKIKDLNGVLKQSSYLEWLFLNSNNLETIDNELPISSSMVFMNISGNLLLNLSKELSTYTYLETVLARRNRIGKIGGVLKGLTSMHRLDMSQNSISVLDDDEFEGMKNLLHLNLAQNNLVSLSSNTLQPLVKLKYLSLSKNLIESFLLDNLSTLKSLKELDLSRNHINYFTLVNNTHDFGFFPIKSLHLEFNNFDGLNGSLKYFHYLEKLNLSYNSLTHLDEDLSTLPYLKILDLSFNKISKLDFKMTLPSLQKLCLQHNEIMDLPHDNIWNMMPHICIMDLSDNLITYFYHPQTLINKCIRGSITVNIKGNPVPCQFPLPTASDEDNFVENDPVTVLGYPTCQLPTTIIPPTSHSDEQDTE